jgi:hypothetical protein
MADRKISDLAALTTPASGDLLPIVDISEAAAASKNKSITLTELFKIPDAVDIATGTTTGTKIGTATTQKLGFWDKTPVVQPTTGISGATFVADSGGSIHPSSTVRWLYHCSSGCSSSSTRHSCLTIMATFQITIDDSLAPGIIAT